MDVQNKRNSEVCFPDTLNTSRSQLKNRKDCLSRLAHKFAAVSTIKFVRPRVLLSLVSFGCKMAPSRLLGTTRCVSQEKLPRKPHNKSFIDRVFCCQDDWIYIGLVILLLLVYGPTNSYAKKEKNTWPISSHLDLKLGQWPVHTGIWKLESRQ